MTFEQALRLLEERSETRIELGLERVRDVLGRLGDPQEKVPAVHVAGTNGKGSVCAFLESVLRAAGYRTGLTTSPHLTDVRERIRIGGEKISGEAFARHFGTVLAAEGARPLTYFELLTCVAFLHFAEAGAEVAILETGLGGRLDATNVVRAPLLTILTSVGLEHVQFLGDTLGRIAFEKAGILKPGVPCVSAVETPEAASVIRGIARERGCALLEVQPLQEAASPDWRSGLQFVEAPGWGTLSLSLLGAHQRRNAAAALGGVAVLRERLPRLDAEAVRRGFSQVRWPGRFDLRPLPGGGGRTLVLDGAHNVEAVRSFARTLRESPFSEGWLILGFLRDKDAAGMLKELAPRLRRVLVVRPDHSRGMQAEEAARKARAAAPYARIDIAPDAEAALEVWLAEGPPSAAVAGSLVLVAEALRWLAEGRRACAVGAPGGAG